MVEPWNRKVVKSSLKMFKRGEVCGGVGVCVCVWVWHLGTWLGGHGDAGLMVRLDDLRDLFHTWQFCASITQNADLVQLGTALCLPAQFPRYFTKDYPAAQADADFDSKEK